MQCGMLASFPADFFWGAGGIKWTTRKHVQVWLYPTWCWMLSLSLFSFYNVNPNVKNNKIQEEVSLRQNILNFILLSIVFCFFLNEWYFDLYQKKNHNWWKYIISLSVNLKHESVKYWMTTSLYFGVENFHDSFWVFFFFFFLRHSSHET